MPPRQPSTRIYAILARKAPRAVVFRRGPTRQVLILNWDTESHEFRLGQWFKGRIYERRCDLSPSGEKLVYFAAKYRAPHRTWTAVSRPPFLTALTLWPKGDAWGGGGLFKNERTLLLNHRADEMTLADEFYLPKALNLEAFGDDPGWGEDEPILSSRLTRDGWSLKQKGSWRENEFGSKLWIEFTEPKIWVKPRRRWTLEMRILGLNQRDGPWDVLEHVVSDAEGHVALSLGRSDWADWSHSGELLFARQGRLYRIAVDPQTGPGAPEELIDLRNFRFEAVEAPPEARQWGGEPVLGRAMIQP